MPSPANPGFQTAPTAAISAYLHPQAVAITLYYRARKRIDRITQNVTRLWIGAGIAVHGFAQRAAASLANLKAASELPSLMALRGFWSSWRKRG
jgi:hypothetical protein